MAFYISVSLDYGAEEFFWRSSFSSSKEVIHWWLEDANLLLFEKSVKKEKCFIPITHNEDQNDYKSLLIYDLFIDNPFHIAVIDNLDYLSYLICENQKIYKNGKIEILSRRSDYNIDESFPKNQS